MSQSNTAIVPLNERLRAAHGDELCHICGKMRRAKGHPLCSYPHRLLPVGRMRGFVAWKEPENVA